MRTILCSIFFLACVSTLFFFWHISHTLAQLFFLRQKVIFKNQLHFNMFPLRFFFHFISLTSEKKLRDSNLSTFANFFRFIFVTCLILTLSLFSFTFLFVVFLSFPFFMRSHFYLSSPSSCYIDVHFIIDERVSVCVKKNFQCHVWLIHYTWFYHQFSFLLSHFFRPLLFVFVRLSDPCSSITTIDIIHNAANRYTLFASCPSSIRAIDSPPCYIHTSYL